MQKGILLENTCVKKAANRFLDPIFLFFCKGNNGSSLCLMFCDNVLFGLATEEQEEGTAVGGRGRRSSMNEVHGRGGQFGKVFKLKKLKSTFRLVSLGSPSGKAVFVCSMKCQKNCCRLAKS